MVIGVSKVYAEDTMPTTVSTSSESAARPPLKSIGDKPGFAKTTLMTTAKDVKLETKNLTPEQKDAMKDKMQQFKDQIAKIKDEKKKTITEKINDNIAANNTKMTGNMTEVLSRMTSIIAKLKEKSSALKTAGKDTVALDGAIATAETAVATAQTAVTAQSQKTYTTTISDDSTLRIAIMQLYNQFRGDILATRQTVLNAKKAVVDAFGELVKISGEKTATTSAAVDNQ